MQEVWSGQVIRTSVKTLEAEGWPAAAPPGESLAGALREMGRGGLLAELAARQGARLQECEVEELLGSASRVAALLTRTRLRVACEAAQRGLHLGSGFTLIDWLARWWPDLHRQSVVDLARLALASREEVHAPLVRAVLVGAMSFARGALLHRVLSRVRRGLSAEEYAQAVELLADAGSNPLFEERDVERVVAEFLRRCLPEDEHERRRTSIWARRDVRESNLADGTVRRLIVTFGDDADDEAVRAVLTSPLAAPASAEEVSATGESDLRTAGNRRYDALMTVLRRGVAGTAGQPTTPKAQLIVTMDYETLRRALGETGPGEPGCGATLDGHLIPASTIRQLACEAGIIPMVLGGPSEVVDQGRAKRLVTPGQRLRLALRDGGCTFPGCSIPATWCDAHHVRHWARGGASDLDNYALLCPRHHTYVHGRDLMATVTPSGVLWHLRTRAGDGRPWGGPGTSAARSPASASHAARPAGPTRTPRPRAGDPPGELEAQRGRAATSTDLQLATAGGTDHPDPWAAPDPWAEPDPWAQPDPWVEPEPESEPEPQPGPEPDRP